MNFLVVALLASQTTGPAADKALLLPITASKQVLKEAPGLPVELEAALNRALARHAPFQVVAKAEVARTLGEAAQAQLQGCDSDSCMAQVADALGAKFLITMQLERVGGNWVLQATLLERASAHALRRADVRVATLEALFMGVDQVARQLAGGSTLALADPQLAARLATTPEVAERLRVEAAKHPDKPVSEVWTDMVIESNRESETLPLIQGALLLAAGAVMAVAFGITGLVSGYLAFVASPFVSGNQSMEIEVGNGTAHKEDSYAVAVGRFAPFMVFPAAGLAAVLVVGALALGGVDALDLGRIPVGKEGCCRDEVRIATSYKPTAKVRWAEVVAIVGGVVSMTSMGVGTGLAVLASMALVIPLGFRGNLHATFPTGPVVSLPFWTAGAVFIILYCFGTISQTFLLGLGLTAGVTALFMMANERIPLVDEHAVTPVKAAPPPAEKVTSPAGSAAP